MSPLNQMFFHREIFADGSNKPNSTLDKFGDEANKLSVPVVYLGMSPLNQILLKVENIRRGFP